MVGTRSKEDTMTHSLSPITLAALLIVGAPVATAQPHGVPVQWGSSSRQVDQRNFDEGYRMGIREGERDARGNWPRDYRRHDAYRRGSSNNGWGWGGWNNGPRSDDAFRRGFAEGYLAGYDQFRGGYGGYGRSGYPGSGYPGGSYGRPGYPDYGGGYGYPGNGGYGYSPAAQRGFDDGYRDGRDDARDRDRYEPTRKRNYREGDDGYSSRYGSREQYKAEYRQAFQQGYDRGYREGRYR
jgi:hypothetical protein